MTNELPRASIDTPAQHRALAHPIRHRLLMSLRVEPATTSQLARRLGVLKGSVAHHLSVLANAGLVRAAESRQVRGGTEQYFEIAVGPIVTAGDDAQATMAMFGAMADEFAGDANALLHLRHVRLSASQAQRVRAALEAIVTDEPQAGPNEPTYGVLVGLYQLVDMAR